MYRNKKETTKLLLLILFILFIPLFFISVETLQKIKDVSKIDPSKVVSNTLDSLYNDIVSQPKNTDPSKVRKCITEIFDLINERQFDKVYMLLTDDIKEYMFPTEDYFIEYMENYLDEKKYSPKFSTYEKLNKEKNDVFIVKVGFLPYSTSESDITASSIVEKNDTFILYFNEDLSYNFSFASYIGTEKYDSTFTKGNLTVKLLKTHLFTSKTEFEVEIINNDSDNSVFIKDEGIIAFTALLPRYYHSPVYVLPNSSNTILFTIYTGFDLRSTLPDEIYFYHVYLGDKFHIFTLPIKYPITIS